MTHQEKLKHDIEQINASGGASHHKWELLLLISIVDSLAAIADCLTEKESEAIQKDDVIAILDKISAEIKDYFSITCDGNCDNCNRVVKNPCGESVDGAWVLHIIDKYKTEAEEAKAHPINENIAKGFEEFTKMMFRQGQAESEET